MKYKCPSCSCIIAKEDRRNKVSKLVVMFGASLDLPNKQAPRLKCNCGMTIILLKGKQ